MLEASAMNSGMMAGKRIPVRKPQTLVLTIRQRTFAYDCNNMALYEVDPSCVIESGLKKSVQDLLQSQASFQSPFAPTPPAVGTIVLEATHLCNLNCRYCFVGNYYPDQQATMTFSTAKRAIDELGRPQDNPDRDMFVGFFGGEPLINFGLMESVVDYCSKFTGRKSPIRHHLTSNATLLAKKHARLLQAGKFSLIVSLDGPEEIHNANRPMKGAELKSGRDRNSFQRTMEALEIIKEHPPLTKSLTLRSTYSADQICLLDRVQFLNSLLYDGKASHVSSEPISLSEAKCVGPVDDSMIFQEPQLVALREEFLKVADWMISEIKAGRTPRFHHIHVPTSRLFNRTPAISECGAGKGYISVGPNGSLYGCHREGESIIGSLDLGFDEELRAKWQDNRFYSRPKCCACPIRLVCGGGCRLNSIQHCGNISQPDPFECRLRLIQFEAAVWMIANLPSEKIAALYPPKKSSPGPRPVTQPIRNQPSQKIPSSTAPFTNTTESLPSAEK